MATPLSSKSYDPWQTCLEGVSYRYDSIHQSICDLCNTDRKVYAFLIIGRILQAAALASIAFTCSIGPVSILIGIFPSTALFLLGSYLAGDIQKINDIFNQITHRFIPGQPIGLINHRNNCWLNSSLQLLTHVPAFQRRMQQIPIFSQFLDQYVEAENNCSTVIKQYDPLAIRRFLSQETRGQISLEDYQEDAAELFEYLFQDRHALYSFDQQVNGGVPVLRREPMLQIDPRLYQLRLSFQEIFNHYFDYNTDVGQHIQLTLPRAPNDLLIQIKRFYQYQDAAGTVQLGKMTDPVDIPERIDLSHRFVRTRQGAQYQCDAFLIHHGQSQHNGHYVAFVKRNGVWWYCSDSYISEVSEQIALANMKHSYICHFAKV